MDYGLIQSFKNNIQTTLIFQDQTGKYVSCLFQDSRCQSKVSGYSLYDLRQGHVFKHIACLCFQISQLIISCIDYFVVLAAFHGKDISFEHFYPVDFKLYCTSFLDFNRVCFQTCKYHPPRSIQTIAGDLNLSYYRPIVKDHRLACSFQAFISDLDQ